MIERNWKNIVARKKSDTIDKLVWQITKYKIVNG